MSSADRWGYGGRVSGRFGAARCRGVRKVREVLALNLLALCLGVAPWAQAQAQAQAADGPWEDAALVHELLRLDAQAALAAEQGRASAASGGYGGHGAGGPVVHGAHGAYSTPAAHPAHAIHAAQSGSVNAHPGSLRESSAIRVHAIYGIGQRLHAELSVGAQRYVYRAGRRLPMGMPFSPDEAVPTLERIAGACVALSRGGQTERHCVNRPTAIAEAQP